MAPGKTQLSREPTMAEQAATSGRYQGGCHCGAVRFEATVDLGQTVTCNCSRCSKLGWIMTFAPEAQFALHSGEDKLTEYLFNRHVIHHQFCRICGIEPFARGTPPGAEMPMVAINVRCLDGVDPTTLSPTAFDGRNV